MPCRASQFTFIYAISQSDICSYEYTVKCTQTHRNGSVTHGHKWKHSERLRNQTRWVGILSLSLCVSCVLFFLPLCSRHLFHITFSALSQFNSAFSHLHCSLSFGSNWAKWVSSDGERRAREVRRAIWIGLRRRGRAAVLRHPAWTEGGNTASDGWRVCAWAGQLSDWWVCVSAPLCVWDAVQERLLLSILLLLALSISFNCDQTICQSCGQHTITESLPLSNKTHKSS